MTLNSLQAQQEERLLFEQANDLYNQGEYDKAIDAYRQILQQGEHSAAVYYNMANSYYKLNEIAPSIYFYEKALLLDPENDDVRNNLAFARNMTIDAIEELPETGWSRFSRDYIGALSYNQWGIAAIILVNLFVIFFLVYYFSTEQLRKRGFFVAAMSCLFLCLIAVTFAYQQYGYEASRNPAIIFAEEVAVQSEPNPGSTEVFTLHEGTKVQVINSLDRWKEIRLADGKTGWLPASELREIKDFTM
ncbi:SH3 domain-containing protein [Robertkochia aurantiaca]|uniref:SH3 domain-containing protein n=1 Tax=Robertkochia aurantiaca TaxID=2873700 RepID=UPI001CCB0EB1|nr:tetratricopeptide repeat protein [Robertkochia sp. 3YJGBD-33]